jgi:hypothetical protein
MQLSLLVDEFHGNHISLFLEGFLLTQVLVVLYKKKSNVQYIPLSNGAPAHIGPWPPLYEVP